MKKIVVTEGRGVPSWAYRISGRIIGMMLGSVILLISAAAAANPARLPGIWLSKEKGHALPQAHEDQLVEDLRRITGLPELSFDCDGKLQLGDVASAKDGATSARQMLFCALGSGEVFIIEDYCGSSSVTFGQMDEGTHYEDPRAQCQLMIWRVRLDFDDFRHMQASPELRETFNAGFTMFHELLHGLGYRDANSTEEIGDCERMVNQVRAELGLPLRDQYFAEQLRVTPKLSTVRLRFRLADTKKSLLNRQTRGRSQYVFFVLPPDSKP